MFVDRTKWYNSYGSPVFDPLEQMERDYIEVCDFSGLPRKLDRYSVDPGLKCLLLTLYEPLDNCPFSLHREIYRNIVDADIVTSASSHTVTSKAQL